MQTRLEALCKSPADDTLKNAQQQFAALTTAWARIQYISFGPIFDHQRAFRIEYWPDKRNVVGRQLAEVLKKQDHAALEPERFATTTVGVQGLPALERMLFGDDALSELTGTGRHLPLRPVRRDQQQSRDHRARRRYRLDRGRCRVPGAHRASVGG